MVIAAETSECREDNDLPPTTLYSTWMWGENERVNCTKGFPRENRKVCAPVYPSLRGNFPKQKYSSIKFCFYQ